MRKLPESDLLLAPDEAGLERVKPLMLYVVRSPERKRTYDAATTITNRRVVSDALVPVENGVPREERGHHPISLTRTQPVSTLESV